MTTLVRRWADHPWLGPEVLVAGLIFLLFSGVAITRDFGWFIIGLMALPVLLLVLLACIGWSVAHRRGGCSIPLALAIAAGSWPLSFCVQTAWDWTAVTLWSVAHRQEIAASAGGDAILTGWGEWGWAGGSTFAYVVSDAQDASSSPAGAERWRRRLNLDCPVAYSLRIRAHLYLVETSDCPFDGVSVSQ